MISRFRRARGPDRRHDGSRSSRSASAGFTLIELIVVVFLLTLFTGLVSAVVMRTLPSASVKDSARKLAATFRRAKVIALARGVDTAVELFPSEGRYRLGDRGEHLLPDGVRMTIQDPAMGDVVEESWKAIFFAEGGSRGGIVQLERDDYRATIRIDPIMGALLE